MPFPAKQKASELRLGSPSRPEPAQPAVCGSGGSRSSEGGALTLQDAAGTLLWPRGLGAQDGPDRLIKDGLQASLGEGRALQKDVLRC